MRCLMNRTIQIKLEDIISNMQISNEQKEELYLRIIGMTNEQGSVVWQGNKIVAFKPHQAMERISLTLKIGD